MGGLVAYLSLSSSRFLRASENLKAWHIVVGYVLGLTIVLCRNYVYYPTTTLALMRVQSLLVIFRRLILAGFFAFVIVEQNWARSSLFKFSRLALVSSMGMYSFGLYLLHPMGLLLAAALLNQLGGSERDLHPTLTCGLLGFPVSLGLSMASYHAYEMPFLKLKKRFAHISSGSI
jgi:peptidoglycan/LPS O-acetylase OafA/YrhL